jgi:hypothetical protein
MTALAVFHALMATTIRREHPWLGEGRSLGDVSHDGQNTKGLDAISRFIEGD